MKLHVEKKLIVPATLCDDHQADVRLEACHQIDDEDEQNLTKFSISTVSILTFVPLPLFNVHRLVVVRMVDFVEEMNLDSLLLFAQPELLLPLQGNLRCLHWSCLGSLTVDAKCIVVFISETLLLGDAPVRNLPAEVSSDDENVLVSIRWRCSNYHTTHFPET